MSLLEAGHHAPTGWRAKGARLTPGDRVAFVRHLGQGRTFVTAGTVFADDGQHVTVRDIPNWGQAVLIVDRSSIVSRKRRPQQHRRVRGVMP